jgi:hypothetical protein
MTNSLIDRSENGGKIGHWMRTEREGEDKTLGDKLFYKTSLTQKGHCEA